MAGGLDPGEDSVESVVNLPPLAIDPDSIVMAGFSSGSFMSHQMHMVYSETIKGVGLIAGGPYYAKGAGAMQSPRNWD